MRRSSIYVVLCLLLGALGVLAPVSVSSAYAAVSTAYAVPTRAEKTTLIVTDVKTITLAQRADHVAAYWRDGKDAHVTLAFSSDGTHFGEPVDAGRDDAGEELHNGMTYGAVQVTDGAIAVRVTTDVPLAQFSVIGISPGDHAPSRLVSAGAPAAAAVDQPTVISRAGWNADPKYLNWAPQFYPAKKLIVHHTTDNLNSNGTQEYYAKLVRSIYYYHAVTQGWGDIAYNFLIDPLGNIYEGRYSDNDSNSPSGEDVYGNGVIGGHTYGYNTGTVGIAVLGTYTSRDISVAARASLEQLLAWEAKKNGIDPTGSDPYHNPFNSSSTIQTWNITGHRDYRSTDCPGTTFYNTLPTIRQDVLNLTGSVTTPTPSPTYIELAASPSSPTIGQQVTITASLIEESSRAPVSGQTVSFATGGIATDPTSLGTAITDSNGVASMQATLTTAGMHWVTAGFDPGTNTTYRGSTTSAEVNVSPTGLSATPGDARVQLSWSAATGASGYNIYRSGVKVNSALVTSASYLDNGLTNGATYSYQVTAIVNGRESAKSPAVSATPGPPMFSDISSSPYQTAISAMAVLDIISGYGNGTFGPNNLVMRKHFAKMIVGAMDLPVSEDDWQDANRPFTDCGQDDLTSTYPHDFIAVAKAHGLTQGKTATTFAPDANITRAQVATMVVRAAQNFGISLDPVGVDYSGLFLSYNNPTHGTNVKLAEYNGLLRGLVTSGTVSSWMNANATRGEVAQILYNLMQITGS
ncbi:MAG: S-layer homology domain-containing protein [Planctomycetota bacterium]